MTNVARRGELSPSISIIVPTLTRTSPVLSEPGSSLIVVNQAVGSPRAEPDP